MKARLDLYQFGFRLWFYALPLGAFGIAAYARFFSTILPSRPAAYDPKFYFVVLLIATLVWAIVTEHYRLCQVEDLLNETVGMREVCTACALTYLILACVLFFYRDQDLSRVFFVLSASAFFLLAGASRELFRLLLSGRYGPLRPRTLVVGADQYARRLAEKLQGVPISPPSIVAHVRLPEQAVSVENVPVYDLSELSNGFAAHFNFDEVIIALPPENLRSLSGLVSQLKPLCVPIRAVVDLGNIPIRHATLFSLGDLQMLELAGSPSESLHYFLLKRAFDLVFSTFVIVFSTPLLLLIAMVIKLTSRGPVLFRQERVGLNGNTFIMYKFRTLSVTDRAKSDTEWNGAVDARPTTFGAFLRRSGLDELPQFFNVLKGEMSVIGPRPERPFFVSQFLKDVTHYNTRHRLKVGITGLAQVNGWRGDTSIQKRLECDLYYIQNWSFWLDLTIAWRTIRSGFFGGNAG